MAPAAPPMPPAAPPGVAEPPPISGPPREALRNRLADKELAIMAREGAVAAVARARSRLEASETTVNRYAYLDDRVKSHYVDNISNDVDTPLPFDLIESLRERQQATERRSGTRDALISLEVEVVSANIKVTKATDATHAAALSVMAELGEEFTDRLEALELAALDVRDMLVSLAHVWISAPGMSKPQQTKSSQKMRTLLNRPPANAAAKHDPETVAIWVNLHQKLLTNPEAQQRDRDVEPT